MSFDSDDIRTLAKRLRKLDLERLQANRSANGFQHFIMDLKDKDAKGINWELKKGLLVVKEGYDAEELMQNLETLLEGNYWFKTRAQKTENDDDLKLPPGLFEEYKFKTLGYWGKNQAMDVGVLVIDEDKSVAVQVIIRFDKTYAFPGGMVDKKAPNETKEVGKQKLLKKCQEEIIEEYYSNDLFAKDSGTLAKAESLGFAAVHLSLNKLLSDPEFSKLSEKKAILLRAFDKPADSIIKRLDNFKAALDELNGEKIKENEKLTFTGPALDIFWVRIKCKLYEELCPKEYKDLCKFLEDNMVEMPETINEADPRNTPQGFMATTPYYFAIEKEKLQEKQESWLVKPKGGDDAISARIVRIEDLVKSGMYSSHCRIMLEMLADKADKDPSVLESKAFQKQLSTIENEIAKREKSELKEDDLNVELLYKEKEETPATPKSKPSVR